MNGYYDPWLVAGAFLIALVAAFVALELARRIATVQGRIAWLWLSGGAFAFGLGIWSMHFVGMLAFHLPIALAYDPLITMLSGVPAVLASGLMLFMFYRGRFSRLRVAVASLVMGLGIAGMHYIGMAAIPVVPAIRYEPAMVGLSVLVAVIVAYAALRLLFAFSASRNFLHKALAATLMAAAVCAMHFTGMAAAQFAPDTVCAVPAGALDSLTLAAIVATNTLVALLVTMGLAVYDSRAEERDRKNIEILNRVNAELRERTRRAERLAEELETNQRSLLQFRTAVESSADAMFLIDRDTMRYADVNETACQLSGYSRDELLRLGPADVNVDSPQEMVGLFDETISLGSQGGRARGDRRLIRRKDGAVVPVEVRRTAVVAGGRQIIVSVARDISERERKERALRESEARFRSLTALSSDWYWEQDEQLRFTFVSGGSIEGGGLAPGGPHPALGKRRWELDLIVDDEALQAHKAMLEGRQPFQNFEFGVRGADGEMLYISTSGVPIFDDEHGRFVGYRGVGRNITAQRRTAQLRESSEQRLRRMVERLPAGAVYVFGNSLEFNPKAEEITGYRGPELPTLDAWFSALYPGRGEAVKTLYLQDRQAAFPGSRVVPIVRKDGTERLVEFVAYGDDAGEIWLLSDVTERALAEEKFRLLFEQSADALLLYDDAGVIDCNAAALTMLHCQRKPALLGVKAEQFCPELSTRLAPAPEPEAGAAASPRRFEAAIRRVDGSQFPAEVALTRFRLGVRSVVLAVWHDLSQRKKSEAATMLAREQLRLALIASKRVLFDWRLASGEVFLDERWAEMLGGEPGATHTTIQALAALVHPDDQQEVASKVRAVVKGETPFYEVEHRVRAASGEYVWVQSQGKVVERDADGRAVRVSGTNADITGRKRAEGELLSAHEDLATGLSALERRNEEMLVLAELNSLLLSCVSVDEACAAIPKYAEQLFAGDRGALFLVDGTDARLELAVAWGAQPEQWSSLTPPECWALRRSRVHQVGDRARSPACQHLAGQDLAHGYTCLPLLLQGDLLGLVTLVYAPAASEVDAPARVELRRERLAGVFSEQVALALSNIRLRDDLRQQTVRDPLTGLHNRRYLDESLGKELARCRRTGGAFSALLIDIDHFKKINDGFGHDAGDAVLKMVARALVAVAREGDVICRYGGEEFVMLLCDTDLPGGEQAALRVLQAVRDLRVEHGGKDIGALSVSIGLAGFPQHGQTKEAVIGAADHAMYRAKTAGRDQLMVGGAPAKDEALERR
jgi:diguanylate cyclase (GGDEF)-like protein/PAS domain S-box-containing protein